MKGKSYKFGLTMWYSNINYTFGSKIQVTYFLKWSRQTIVCFVSKSSMFKTVESVKIECFSTENEMKFVIAIFHCYRGKQINSRKTETCK